MSLDFLLRTIEETNPITKEDTGISLKGILQRERLKLKKAKEPRILQPTFNPSLITFGFCNRLKVAQLAGKIELKGMVPTPKQQLMFDTGNAFHDIIQGYFWDIGILEGQYYCYNCHNKFYGVSPKSCSSCNKRSRHLLRYNEVPLRNEEYKVVGRADGILVGEPFGDEKHLVDIKSIANRPSYTAPNQIFFEDLKEKGPKEAYKVQLNLYMWMSEIHKGHLLFVSKQTHQLESFYYDHDYQLIKPYLDDIKALIEWAKSGAKLPDKCDDKKCECHNI